MGYLPIAAYTGLLVFPVCGGRAAQKTSSFAVRLNKKHEWMHEAPNSISESGNSTAPPAVVSVHCSQE